MHTTPTNAADGPDIQHMRWRIDPERSSVEFHVRNMYGLQRVKGRFERYDGELDLAPEPSIELTIDADSLIRTTPGATSTCGPPSSSIPPTTRRFDSCHSSPPFTP
jgi:hypothetical protein